ncbi:hypothetical protein NLJ89_g2732 [Agrocybe chaxingu]|uniref:Uncharacterized protein n=1 Tax=Agrocybe chaxingu TaxID=84603 RepID=A0A9W8K697_9AGAR|nr:hypothetical protein NLJ89_g2732 [Agrocybe chaxingu]
MPSRRAAIGITSYLQIGRSRVDPTSGIGGSKTSWVKFTASCISTPAMTGIVDPPGPTASEMSTQTLHPRRQQGDRDAPLCKGRFRFEILSEVHYYTEHSAVRAAVLLKMSFVLPRHVECSIIVDTPDKNKEASWMPLQAGRKSPGGASQYLMLLIRICRMYKNSGDTGAYPRELTLRRRTGAAAPPPSLSLSPWFEFNLTLTKDLKAEVTWVTNLLDRVLRKDSAGDDASRTYEIRGQLDP